MSGYFASSDDVYVANSHIRRYNLRRGDAVTGAVRQLRDGERKEKFNPLVRLDTVNGVDPEQARNRVEFGKLTPLSSRRSVDGAGWVSGRMAADRARLNSGDLASSRRPLTSGRP